MKKRKKVIRRIKPVSMEIIHLPKNVVCGKCGHFPTFQPATVQLGEVVKMKTIQVNCSNPQCDNYHRAFEMSLVREVLQLKKQ